jgi:hypothetical protein
MSSSKDGLKPAATPSSATASGLHGRETEEREKERGSTSKKSTVVVEARKGGARTYNVLLDWPLMEILCLPAFDSLPPLFPSSPAVHDDAWTRSTALHCSEIQHNKSNQPSLGKCSYTKLCHFLHLAM